MAIKGYKMILNKENNFKHISLLGQLKLILSTYIIKNNANFI